MSTVNKPDRIYYDPKKGIFYDSTPFGRIIISDASINAFRDNIMEINYLTSKQKTSIVCFLTENRLIEPSFFLNVIENKESYIRSKISQIIGKENTELINGTVSLMKLCAQEVRNF